MLGFGSATRVYVAVGTTDMRKGFEGLFGIVCDVTKREKRACKSCEEQGVQCAPLPARIIEKVWPAIEWSSIRWSANMPITYRFIARV